jgi:hypothetical protein
MIKELDSRQITGYGQDRHRAGEARLIYKGKCDGYRTYRLPRLKVRTQLRFLGDSEIANYCRVSGKPEDIDKLVKKASEHKRKWWRL